MPEEIDTLNKFVVCRLGDDLVIMRPHSQLSDADALLLAAYLVALAEGGREAFDKVYEAVCNV